MAIQTKEELLALAGEIKIETAAQANTALRVGTILEDIVDSTLRWKEYTILLSYNGSVFTVKSLLNTLGDGTGVGSNDIVWSYLSNTVIYADMTNAFVADKTFFYNSTFGSGVNSVFVTGERVNSSSLSVSRTLYDGTQPAVSTFTDLPISIKVYS
jgi:hypothetical protein